MVDVTALTDAIVSAGRKPLNRASGIPMAAYHHQALYEIEVERLFRPNWLMLGRGDQVDAPNSYLAIDLVGEPLLLTRDAAGELHVFSRLCPHRGMEIATGAGQTKTLVCPYHVWSFDLAGRCKHAPHMAGNETFDPVRQGLRPVRFEVWNGFVFVNLDGRAAPLAPQIQPLTDMLAEFNLADTVVAGTMEWGEFDIDWKLMLENSVECYHHLGTHAKSLQATYPAELAWTLPDTKNFTLTYAVSTAEERTRDDDVSAADLIDSNTNRLITIFPYTRLSVRKVSTSQLQIIPLGPGRIRLRTHILLPRAEAQTPEARAFIEASFKRSTTIVGEDVDMCGRLQKMSASRSLDVGPLSPLEAPVWQFYQFLSQTLSPAPLGA